MLNKIGGNVSSALVDKFFDAVMNGDMDTVRSCFHDNIVGVDHGTGKVSTGVEENMADVQEWLANFSDVKITSRGHHESGNTVITEMTFTGTNTGDMAMPDGSSIPATGKTVTMHGCQFVQFQDGKMVNTRQYYDMMGMMAQLGLMPS